MGENAADNPDKGETGRRSLMGNEMEIRPFSRVAHFQFQSDSCAEWWECYTLEFYFEGFASQCHKDC